MKPADRHDRAAPTTEGMHAMLTHDELTTRLADDWIENTGCDREAAEIRADIDMGMMHDAGTCPVCNPAERDELNYIYPAASACGMWFGQDDSCEMGYRDFPDDRPNPGCDACRWAARNPGAVRDMSVAQGTCDPDANSTDEAIRAWEAATGRTWRRPVALAADPDDLDWWAAG